MEIKKKKKKETSEDTQEMPQSQSTTIHGTKRRDEKRIMTKQTPHMKPTTHLERRTAIGDRLGTVRKKTTWDEVHHENMPI